MRLNPQLVRINRNFLICFICSATLSSLTAHLLSDFENYLNTTITIMVGYVVYFGIFSCLFYLDNKSRYKQMSSHLIKKELLKIISSFGVGEIVYLGVRWPSLYYFLEFDFEPFLASISSEIIATTCYMIVVTIFLKTTKTFK